MHLSRTRSWPAFRCRLGGVNRPTPILLGSHRAGIGPVPMEPNHVERSFPGSKRRSPACPHLDRSDRPVRGRWAYGIPPVEEFDGAMRPSSSNMVPIRAGAQSITAPSPCRVPLASRRPQARLRRGPPEGCRWHPERSSPRLAAPLPACSSRLPGCVPDGPGNKAKKVGRGRPGKKWRNVTSTI